VGYSAEKIFLIYKPKKLVENKYFRKIHSIHESGSQVEQVDEKIGGKKSRGTIPLKLTINGDKKETKKLLTSISYTCKTTDANRHNFCDLQV
jgi:hypothetical protein